MNNVQLVWNRNTEPDLLGYNVYRSATSGGPYSKINSVLVGQPPVGAKPLYVDVNVANQTWFYVVRAVNSAGESGNSNEAVSLPINQPPAPPTGLTATTAPVSVSLSVDQVPVANVKGPLPVNLNYNLPRSTPPRDRLLSIKVDQ